jgi:hypothetical protein
MAVLDEVLGDARAEGGRGRLGRDFGPPLLEVAGLGLGVGRRGEEGDDEDGKRAVHVSTVAAMCVTSGGGVG